MNRHQFRKLLAAVRSCQPDKRVFEGGFILTRFRVYGTEDSEIDLMQVPLDILRAPLFDAKHPWIVARQEEYTRAKNTGNLIPFADLPILHTWEEGIAAFIEGQQSQPRYRMFPG